MSADGHSDNHRYRYTSLLRLQAVRFGNTVCNGFNTKVSGRLKFKNTPFLGCWVKCQWYFKMSENASLRSKEREKPQGLPFNSLRGSRLVGEKPIDSCRWDHGCGTAGQVSRVVFWCLLQTLGMLLLALLAHWEPNQSCTCSVAYFCVLWVVPLEDFLFCTFTSDDQTWPSGSGLWSTCRLSLHLHSSFSRVYLISLGILLV